MKREVIMTFEWEDITDELLEKVVCFSYKITGGGFEFTGQPDFLHAVTENGQEYVFGLDECPQANYEYEILDRLLGKCPVGLSDHEIAKWRCDRLFKKKQTGEVGKWRWEDSLYGTYLSEMITTTEFIPNGKKNGKKIARTR